jgi:nitroreductase/NAD-dependent dihydropyrimidine dehydrogenase PreA subunit
LRLAGLRRGALYTAVSAALDSGTQPRRTKDLKVSQITVDPLLCKRDGICVAVCPARVLFNNSDGLPEEIPGSTCIHCGHCEAVCRSHALSLTGLETEALLPMPEELPSPRALDGLLRSRRSIRSFRPEPVPREILEELLDTARRAPTATNSQLLHWIVVRGREQVHEVATEIVEGMKLAGVDPAILERWNRGEDFALRGAPTLVVACAPLDYFWAREDCAIALTFLELAAEARGLGACWAGYLTRCAARHAPLRELLQVPQGFTVGGGLMLGRSQYKFHRIPPRKPLSVQWQ